MLQIIRFLGKELSEEDVDDIVNQATFETMKSIPQANYVHVAKSKGIVRHNGEYYMRKGDVPLCIVTKMLSFFPWKNSPGVPIIFFQVY